MITLQTPRASEKPYSTARGGEDHHPPPLCGLSRTIMKRHILAPKIVVSARPCGALLLHPVGRARRG